MSLLLSILLLANMIGAILVVPAFTTVFKPRFAQAVGDKAGAGVEAEGST
jgi:hypothetical protein